MTTLAWLVQKSPFAAKVPQEMARWDAVCRQLRGFRWGTAQNSIAAIYCVSCSIAIWRAEGKHSILVCRVCIPGAGWCIPDAWSFCVHAWANGPFPHWTTHSRIISSLSPSVCGSGCATSFEASVEALLQDVILHPADQVWNEAERLFLSFSRYHATNLRTGLHVGKHGCPWNAIGSRHRILAHVIRDSANLLHVGLGCTLALRWWASLQPLLSSSLSTWWLHLSMRTKLQMLKLFGSFGDEMFHLVNLFEHVDNVESRMDSYSPQMVHQQGELTAGVATTL